MKFVRNAAGEMTQVDGGNWLLDKVNGFADWVVDKEIEIILKPLVGGIGKVALATWDWFVANLPDIMGYGSIAAGALIILSSMLGNGGIVKTVGWYFGALIIAICILGGV